MYYYVNAAGQQQGPVPAGSLLANGVKGDTLVWKLGMQEWKKAKDVPELNALFGAAQVPPIPPINSQSTRPTTPFNQQSQLPPKPDNNLVWAIITTVLCCLPLGAYAIYLSMQVDKLYYQGNYSAAEEKAKEVRKMSIIGACVGFVVNIIYLIIVIASEM